jgi:hypothetical protein
MADRYPLIYNPSANQIQELQSGDSLDIGNASLKNVASVVGVLTATSFSGDGSALTNLPAGATPTLDAVTTQGNTTTNSITVGSISAATATFSGSISVGGTITYEDVTNVDSVGVVTARTGLKVLAGGADIVGATTATSFVKTGGTSSEFLKADGTVDSSTYITAIGIQSGGVSIGNATTLNFIGAGNTFAVDGSTIVISISGGGGAAAAATYNELDSALFN